jgi:hypothetical protein
LLGEIKIGPMTKSPRGLDGYVERVINLHRQPTGESAQERRRNSDGAAKEDAHSASNTAASLGEWDAGNDPGPIPPRQWFLANQFCGGFISSIVSAGGVGKSALRLLRIVKTAPH